VGGRITPCGSSEQSSPNDESLSSVTETKLFRIDRRAFATERKSSNFGPDSKICGVEPRSRVYFLFAPVRSLYISRCIIFNVTLQIARASRRRGASRERRPEREASNRARVCAAVAAALKGTSAGVRLTSLTLSAKAFTTECRVEQEG